MEAQHDAVAAMRAVTLSREYGSGGGEVAARLARRLGWQLLDHEVVVRVAQALGVAEAEAAAYDEQEEGLAARFLRELSTPAWFGGMPGAEPGSLPPAPAVDAQRYHATLCRIVEAAATAGGVVIVGRGAQALLAAWRDVLHARVVAPLDQRVAYVARREGLAAEAARARIAVKERDRTRYLRAHYQRDPADPQLYDLVVNTGVLALDDAVDLIALALARKAAGVTAPAEVLGPLGTLGRYPGPPGDLRPPPGGAGPAAES